jgi:hypothetical protein
MLRLFIWIHQQTITHTDNRLHLLSFFSPISIQERSTHGRPKYCHVWGVCVTHNNGFWIGWLDLLALLLQSLLFTIIYSAIVNLPILQISRTCSILVLEFFCTLLYSSVLLPTTDFNSHSRILCCTSLYAVVFRLSWLCCSFKRSPLHSCGTDHAAQESQPRRGAIENTCLHHFFYSYVTSPRTRKLRALHSNGCTRHVSWHLLHCCVQASPSHGWCLQSHLLATSLYATIHLW